MIGVAHMTGLSEIDACFDMITGNGAKSLHIADYGLSVGNPVNIVVLGVPNAFDALRYQVQPRVVISQGRIISETAPAKTTLNI
jgi:cytosine deaminase